MLKNKPAMTKYVGGVSHPEPKILSAIQPKFQLLSANVSFFLSSRSRTIESPFLQLFTGTTVSIKRVFVTFAAQFKGVVLEICCGLRPQTHFVLPLQLCTFSKIHVAFKFTIFKLIDTGVGWHCFQITHRGCICNCSALCYI